ncbi:MAG: hypothetical protein EXS16_12940 [Gemmataceae bacterium]|nr:hypothetical protein [Gemmataceae bacterium]
MTICRYVLGLLLFAVVSMRAAGQGVDLTEAPLDKACVRNEITMELKGTITIVNGKDEQKFPHGAEAKHVYTERFLDVNGAVALKSARYYTVAESVLAFNNDKSAKRTLRPEHRFMVTHRQASGTMSFSLKGSLTREEMETTEHFNTLAVSGLIPGKMIEVGKSWAMPNGVVVALCDLQGVTKQNFEGKLIAVKDDIATFKVVGNADGISLGAQVKTLVNADCEFDLKKKRIVAVTWNQEDTRLQGPVGPAMTASITVKLKRDAIEVPVELSDNALIEVPVGDAPSNLTNIQHGSSKDRFSLRYARDWHVTSPDGGPQMVLRNIDDRGQFVGQVTVSMWKKGDPANVISLEKFAAETERTIGWNQTEETERKELKELPKGHHTAYRVIANGELDGQRAVQYFYLIVSKQGDHLLATFTLPPEQAARLGSRDVEFVREIGFPEAKE